MRKLLVSVVLVLLIISGYGWSIMDPIEQATKNVFGLIWVGTLGEPEIIEVEFSPNYIFAAKVIADSTDKLGKDQLCVLIGASKKNDDRFEYRADRTGLVIDYKGNTVERVSLFLMCSEANKLNQDLIDNEFDNEINTGECAAEFNEYLVSGNSTEVCVAAILDESYGGHSPSPLPSLTDLFIGFINWIFLPASFIYGAIKKDRKKGIVIMILAAILFILMTFFSLYFSSMVLF